MICERTGFKTRRSDMRQEWTGAWVRKDVWRPRHPQDFVRGIPDNPSVSPVRNDVVQAVGESTLQDDMEVFESTNVRVYVVALSGLAEGDPIGVYMNNGATHWSFIDDLETLTGDPLEDSEGDPILDANGDTVSASTGYSGYVATLNTPISFDADFENAVYLPSLNNESWDS